MFNTQNVGGITRYFYELFTNFDLDQDVTWEMPITYSSNLYLKKHASYVNKLLPNPVKYQDKISTLSKLNFISEKLLYKIHNMRHHDQYYGVEYIKDKELNIKKIKEGNFDLFHPTYFDDYFMDYIGDKPFVLTIHDLINQIFPEISLHHPIDKTKSMIVRADRIITVSESTKRDLINIFDVDEQKIDVIYLANPLDHYIHELTKEFKAKLPQNYLLYVGGRWDYKNFLFFIQMFSSLKKKHPHLTVVCTGSSFNSSEKYLFNKLGINDSVYNFFVTDEELSYLYKNAIAFVFPSMYEGFGLPILEALSCGCPVVASKSSSLTEVGGDAAVYFEPKNPGSLLSALDLIVSDVSVRKEKIEIGYEQLQKFSWKNTARQTKHTYEKTLAYVNYSNTGKSRI